MNPLRPLLAALAAGCACGLSAAQSGPWHSADRSWFADAPGCTPRAAEDFIDAGSWNGRRLLPRDCRLLEDRAPLFAWPEPADRDPAEPWTLTLRDAAGAVVATRRSRVPRLMFDEALAPGAYSWTVRYQPRGGGDARSSAVRRFAVAPGARAEVMPAPAALARQIMAKPHPRLAPDGSSLAAIGGTARTGEQAAGYAQLLKTADDALPQPPARNPEGVKRALHADDASFNEALTRVRNDAGKEGYLVEVLAYAWHFTGNERYRDAALARLRNLAAWPADGATSEQSQDQANRNIYLALATGADLLWSALDDGDRQQIGQALRTRLRPVVAQFGGLDANPYNSHLQTAVGHATTALALAAGLPGFPEAADWLAQALELWTTQRYAWGEEDGGMGNGTAYAWYDLMNLARSAAEMRAIAGVDLLARGFGRRLGDFIMAVTPTPAKLPGAFGDETETDYLHQAYAGDGFRLYALLSRQPQHAWYWRQDRASLAPKAWFSAIHLVAEAAAGKPVAPAAPTRTNWVFEDVGLAAFHSDPVATRRGSLFFKSSRFGAYNHSHADQNSIVLHSNGVALLVSGGYYPYYGSPHHLAIGRATRYQNALTVDGGIGQAEAVTRPVAPTPPEFSMDARGALIAAGGNDAVALATGDATLAYRGHDAASRRWVPLLTDAVRSVAYLRREKVTVLYDWATSASPRRWELNLHAFAPFESKDGGVVRVERDKASACITHHGPAGAFTTKSGFEVAPERPRPPQVHGRYTVAAPSTELAIVTVIREDCSDVPVAVSVAGTEATVRVGEQTLRFDKRRAQWRE